MRYTPSGTDTGGPEYRYDVSIPAGDREATVVKAIEKYSSSGNPMIVLTLGTDVPNQAVKGGCADHYLVFTPAAEFKVREAVVAMFPELVEAWDAKTEVDLNPEMFVGKRTRATFYNEEYDGKMYNKVRALFPSEHGPGETTTPAAPATPTAPVTPSGW